MNTGICPRSKFRFLFFQQKAVWKICIGMPWSTLFEKSTENQFFCCCTIVTGLSENWTRLLIPLNLAIRHLSVISLSLFVRLRSLLQFEQWLLRLCVLRLPPAVFLRCTSWSFLVSFLFYLMIWRNKKHSILSRKVIFAKKCWRSTLLIERLLSCF